MDFLAEKIGANFNYAFILVYGTLIWTRLLGVVAVVPFLFGKPVPNSVRVGSSVVLAMFFYFYTVPAQPPPIPEDKLLLMMLYIKETFIGFSIGFAVSILFYGFDAAGHMIDNQRGMSIARILIPQLGTMGSLTGNLLFQMAIVTYLSIGGHRLFIEALAHSYEVFPLFEFPNIGLGMLPLIDVFIRMSAEVLMMSVQIAAPVIIAILVADIILGVANRIAPQINVWELGFNVKGYIGILILFMAMGTIANEMVKSGERTNQYTMRVINYMEGLVPEEETHPEDELWDLFRIIPGTPESQNPDK